MDSNLVKRFKDWFSSYVATFSSSDPDFQRNIDLKEEHTRRVCQNAVDIGKDLGLKQEDICLAEIAALFHDLGRFEQYKQYKTFSDKNSVNHAAFGVKVLKEKGVLDMLEAPLKKLIIKVVSFHNRVVLPKDEDDRCRLLSRLIRDADKLDIWKVVTEYYGQKDAGQTNETIELDLPDTPEISEEIYENLIQGKPNTFDSMNNLNDFKLLQVGWIYDINFLPSLERLKQRGYMGLMQKALPETKQIKAIFSAVDNYMNTMLNKQGKTFRTGTR